MDRGELHVHSDSAALAAAMADLFVDIGQTAITDRGTFNVALAGGNTPRAAYSLLALEPYCDELSWSEVHVYFGDERCVPPEDDQSNYHMAEKTFLSSVPIPVANVHRMQGEIDPQLAAADYARALRENIGEPPRFDLILLGMGPDGHTASLFPGSPPDADNGALVRAVYADSKMSWRLTMTPLVLNAARNVVFSVEGVEKAAALAAVLQGPIEPAKYPAQIVHPTDGRLIWLVDDLAVGLFEKKST